MLIAIASWFIMSDSIDVAPWLTPEEKGKFIFTFQV